MAKYQVFHSCCLDGTGECRTSFFSRFRGGKFKSQGFPRGSTHSRNHADFFFVFTHSRIERKIEIFMQYRKKLIENGSFHEITHEKFSHYTFTQKIFTHQA